MNKFDRELAEIILNSENMEETLFLALKVFSAFAAQGEAYPELQAEDQEVSS